MKPKKIKFTKMHGLGNDFVVIDGRETDIKFIKRKAGFIADRRFGAGCDQLIVLGKSTKADYRMLIYNADGSEVEMCGNGIRCLAKYLRDKKITKKKTIRFETLGGTKETVFKGEEVEVDMGSPILEAPKIPVNLEGRVINYNVKILDREFSINCLSMGNPHCVVFLDDLNSFEVAKYGPELETHKLFPNKINVEFVRVLSKKRLRMKVWERGSGETLACGTGACASAVAANLVGKAGKEVTVDLQAGSLQIRWDENTGHVFMRGPATSVYTGIMEF